MQINKLIIQSIDSKREFNFENKITIISSDDKNSQGKSTVIRSLLFGIGLIIKNDFVDGTKINGFNTKIIFDNGMEIHRKSNKIDVYKKTDETSSKIIIEKRFDLKNDDGQKELIKYYKNIFDNDWDFIQAYLFACYSDQQYGKHVVNRGRTGPFPKFLSFSMENLARSLNNNYDTLQILKNEKKKLNSYENDLKFIKDNVKLEKNQMSFDDVHDSFISQTLELKKLEEKILYLKKIRKVWLKRKSLLSFFEKDFTNLELIYKDDNGNNKLLSIDNFIDGIEIRRQTMDFEISKIEKRIKNLKSKIEERSKYIKSDNLIDSNEIQKIKFAIINNKVKMSENSYNDLYDEKKKIENNIIEIENNLKQEQMEILEIDIQKYLVEFGKVNKDIKFWSMENKSNNYKIFLEDNSKFVTYVGAIRFLITTSFKFSIIKYLWKKGINLPIIIDNLFPEELSENIKIIYLKMLFNFNQRIIISEMNNDFMGLYKKNKIDEPEYFEIVVKKDIFKEKQIKLFSSQA